MGKHAFWKASFQCLAKSMIQTHQLGSAHEWRGVFQQEFIINLIPFKTSKLKKKNKVFRIHFPV